MKRVLAILMALVMLFSMAACTGSGNGDNETKTYEFTTGYDEAKYNTPGTFPIFKEKQTISVMLPDSQYVEDWDTNKQTLMLEEDLNADLVLDVLPSGEYNTKINLMAASGGEEFKDVVIGGFSDGMILNLADSEVIVPLTEYFYNKDIAYYSIEAIDRIGWNYYPYITMPDGEIYAFPRVNDSISNPYADRMWVYTPWFDAAGIDFTEIRTTEDFKNAFNTIVKSDPNGNGKADEVGLTSYGGSRSWFRYMMNPFVYAGEENYMYVRDGEVGFAYQTDEWREGLEWMKELYDLGLIDPLTFSQDSTSYKAMLNYSETIATAFVTMGTGYINEGDPRRYEYKALNPLNSKWNDGKPLATEELAAPVPRMFVSCNAEDVESAFTFGDYLVSEKVSIWTRWGEEGIDWIAPENEMSALEGYPVILKETENAVKWSALQNVHWVQTGPFIRQVGLSAGSFVKEEDADQLRRYLGTGPEENIVKLIYTEDENEITTEGLANLEAYVDEMTAKFITGIETLDDAGWEKFQNQLEVMNAAGVLECAQAAYDRMMAVAG